MVFEHPAGPNASGQMQTRRLFRPELGTIHLHEFDVRIEQSVGGFLITIFNAVGGYIYSEPSDFIFLSQSNQKLSFAAGDIDYPGPFREVQKSDEVC